MRMSADKYLRLLKCVRFPELFVTIDERDLV